MAVTVGRVPAGGSPEAPGQMIGPYRLLAAIGEGGFGIVWLAERREPMVQRVAIKVIKPGMDSREVIARCIAAAGCAPSGANQQPWRFVAIAEPSLKRSIRVAAEEEERAFYAGRAPQEWLDALAPLALVHQIEEMARWLRTHA